MKERYEKFFEMVKVGQINGLIIEVYTDHDPAHFHVTKKDKFEVRLNLKNMEILSYKWQKDGSEISSTELKKISRWLKDKYKNKNITNKDAIEIFWDGMNSN